MALLFVDGFDHYTGDVAPSMKWSSQGSWGQTDTQYARTGTRSMNLYYQQEETRPKLLGVPSGGFVMGGAFRTNNPYTLGDILRVKEDTITHLALGVTTAGVLQVKLGATVLATGTTVLPQNTFNYVEFKGTIHSTTGSYEVRINSIVEAALTATNVNTRNGGTTGQWTTVSYHAPSHTSFCFVDDVYVCDQSGALNNDFLGPVRIETLMPQPGNGSNVGLTPSTGTDHGALVDEIPPNTTDYNSSDAVGAKDTYNLANMAGVGTLLGVQVNLYTVKTESTPRKICHVVRAYDGATMNDYDGANMDITTSYGYLSAIFPLNPATGLPWVTADIDALEAGLKITV